MTFRIKRCFDVFLSVLALTLLVPVIVAVALAVRYIDGHPILFRQVRPGYKTRPFALFKFRTMTNERDTEGRLLPDSERLTRLGYQLRRFSLDELPQLWNVLKGDMSLVGPRPLLMSYLPRYSPQQLRRHDVPPGITGWAQIQGRNALTWPAKFALDLWYVENRSFPLDLQILVRTIGQVFREKGIVPKGQASVPEFLNSEVNQS